MTGTRLVANASVRDCLTRIAARYPLRAASFIVTIYGDVVEPRGGVLWIGNLIETCAGLGISESLVRTAVSRLMAGGQLVGSREGRRSFYRLTPPARQEFAAAASVLFGAADAQDWQFVHLLPDAPEGAMTALERAGHARLGPQLAVGPARPGPLPVPGLVFHATVAQDGEALRDFAAQHWALDTHAEAYRAFLAAFAPLATLLEGGATLDGALGLRARLMLVHHFRRVLLNDPRLPPRALPSDWPGATAASLFARLYLALSPAADRYVARNFLMVQDHLPEGTEATLKRLNALEARVREDG